MSNIPTNPGSNPLFKFEGQSVRVVMIKDKPWFVAVDILRCLDMDANQSGNYLRHLGADERGMVQRSSITQGKAGRGCAYCAIISESGLYKLIMRSDKPAAKRFQDWVTRDVLPALRKDGMYVMGEEKVRTGEMSHHLPRKPAGYEVIFTRQ